MKTQAWVCPSKGAKLELREIELGALQPHEVQVELTHCGLCHTDIHMRDNDWGVSNYPMVAGHEGVGKVVAVGNRVKNVKVGDRVGIGWLRDSCGSCHRCLAGRDNLCINGSQGTYLGSSAGMWGKEDHSMHGCFAKTVNIAEKFAFKIPDNISDTEAAPLLCAGITIWEPIAEYVKPNTKVGIVALGGLGHLAVMFAVAVGAEVWALSTSPDKEQRAKELGAHHFVNTKDPKDFEKIAGQLDVIIDTCPAALDLGSFMNSLAMGGTYCKIGIPAKEFTFGYIPLIFTQKKIAGSIVCGSLRTNEMLGLASHHGIRCETSEVPFDQINEAMDTLAKGENKTFRMVLKW